MTNLFLYFCRQATTKYKEPWTSLQLIYIILPMTKQYSENEWSASQ